MGATLGAAALSLTLAGCGSSSDDSSSGNTFTNATKAGDIRIGLVQGQLPLSDLADGKATGYFPEVAIAALKEMGIPKVVPSAAGWDGLIPGLQAKRWDLITTGLNVTKERCDQLIYSRPIVDQPETLLVKAGNPKNITAHADFAKDSSLKLAEITGSADELFALGEAKIPKNQVIEATDEASLADLMLSGRADAGANTLSTNELLSKQHPGKFDIVKLTDVPPTLEAVGFRSSDTELRDKFNAALDKMEADGSLATIYKKWGFTNADEMLASKLSQAAPNCK